MDITTYGYHYLWISLPMDITTDVYSGGTKHRDIMVQLMLVQMNSTVHSNKIVSFGLPKFEYFVSNRK